MLDDKNKRDLDMKLERLLPLLLLPGAAHAGGGGGGILVLIIFLPLMIWAFIKIWGYWFRLIFGGREEGRRPTYQVLQSYSEGTVVQAGMSPDMKICPFCAELIQSKAIKCKHCGSDLQ